MRSSNGASIGTWRTRLSGTRVGRKSASPARASANSSTCVPAPRQRLGDRERVHDAAARLDRVGEHRDPHGLHRVQCRGRAGSSRPLMPHRRRGGRVGGRDDHARLAQRRLLAPRVLRVAVGAAHVGDHRAVVREPAPALGAARPPGRRASRGRSRRRAARSRRRRRRRSSMPEPHLEVDHRVRAALRVLLLAEVEDHVAVAVAVAGVAADRAERAARARHRLMGERAAARTARAARPPRAARVDLAPRAPAMSGASTLGGRERARVERRVDLERRLAAVPADERGDHALAVDVDVARAAARPRARAAWTPAAASRSRRRPPAAASPRANMIPPTSADRSRPPTPMICDTPTPAPSSRIAASCAPVPAAATMPTGPGA